MRRDIGRVDRSYGSLSNNNGSSRNTSNDITGHYSQSPSSQQVFQRYDHLGRHISHSSADQYDYPHDSRGSNRDYHDHYKRSSDNTPPSILSPRAESYYTVSPEPKIVIPTSPLRSTKYEDSIVYDSRRYDEPHSTIKLGQRHDQSNEITQYESIRNNPALYDEIGRAHV